jgi:hypothetical protein
MNKSGQFGIIAFVAMFIILLFLAPFVIKIVRTSVGGFSDQITVINSEAGANVDFVEESFLNLWDWVILLAFGFNVMLLLISSFFIDTEPAFVIVYILTVFFLMSFAPSALDSIQDVYNELGDASTGHDSGAYLPATEFLINNFGGILLSIIVLSGIIMYAKFKYFT